MKTEPYGEHNQHNIVLVKLTEEEVKKIQLRNHEHSQHLWIDPKDVKKESGKFLAPLLDICQDLTTKLH